MKILVYGAGPLGTLFTALLHEAGHEVSILARGQRLADLRQHGVVIVNTQTGLETTARVKVVERLDPEDAYDLVLVIMRKNRVGDILPALAANRRTPNVLFLGNNAAGPAEWIAALGKERVLIGFPMAAGYRRGHVVHYLVGARADRKVHIPFGEVDGTTAPRTLGVANILASMPGFDAEIRPDMDAWLKTHVALLMPSMAPAMRAAGRDNVRMARTRDLVVLTVRAIREGFQVLRALGIPVIPTSIRRFELLPEPVIVWYLQRVLVHPRIRIAMLEHAEAAHDEIEHLANEFYDLARQAGVPTPAMNRLRVYLDPAPPLMPDGNAEIPLDWRSAWIGLGVTAGVLIAARQVFHLFQRGRANPPHTARIAEGAREK